MTVVKTAELTGAALDWAVAKCEGQRLSGASLAFQVSTHGTVCTGSYPYSPSTNWAIGGPIIERERIAFLAPATGEFWDARDSKTFTLRPVYFKGPSPLIAAMRCYVSSKLGDTVEVPEELL